MIGWCRFWISKNWVISLSIYQLFIVPNYLDWESGLDWANSCMIEIYLPLTKALSFDTHMMKRFHLHSSSQKNEMEKKEKN